MARKTLLTESELRQFMKLANLRPIGDTRLNEFGYNQIEEEEAGPEELESFAADDLADDTLEGDEEAATDEMEAADELDDDMGLEDDAGGADMVSVDDFMSALENALEDVLGEPVETELDDEEDLGDGDEEADMEMNMDVEAGPDELEMTASDVEMDEDPPGMRSAMYESEDAIVNEVARRVAARLQAKESKQQTIDQLAERILNRLTAK